LSLLAPHGAGSDNHPNSHNLTTLGMVEKLESLICRTCLRFDFAPQPGHFARVCFTLQHKLIVDVMKNTNWRTSADSVMVCVATIVCVVTIYKS
jgi:hypothetical protein